MAHSPTRAGLAAVAAAAVLGLTGCSGPGPDGTAALRCSAERLTLEAENLTLSLTRR